MGDKTDNEVALSRLLEIMSQLRSPDTGCPWDIKQDFKSIAPYTIEEAYEVADAIERNDYLALKEELGDLLLQVVYHAQIAQEKKLFNFNDVIHQICEKMIERHPHVFNYCENTNQDLSEQWETHKEKERLKKGNESILSGIARNLPQLNLAYKIQSRVARVGFDWDNSKAIFSKINEELEEIHDAISDKSKLEEELGDLLFTIVNLTRHYSINPETALRKANQKFERRFRRMEKKLQSNGGIKQAKIDEMEEEWRAIKLEENT